MMMLACYIYTYQYSYYMIFYIYCLIKPKRIGKEVAKKGKLCWILIIKNGIIY